MDLSLGDLGLRSDFSHLSDEVRDLIRHSNRGQYPTHSEAAVAVCVELLWAAYGVAEIWMILTDPNNGISEAFFSIGATQAEDWLERIIREADVVVAQS